MHDLKLHCTFATASAILIGSVLAAVRIWMGLNIEPEVFEWLQAYKDVAHVFIGGLAVAWWFQRSDWQWWLFWALNAVEVSVAILSRI